jgi:ergothioneine biosynthesis protein EgtB
MTVRQATEAACAPLSDEDCGVQSMPEASPVKWHLAHTTWFFETFLLQRIDPEQPPHDARFSALFNSYYHSVGPRHERAARGVLSRPSLAEVRRYRDEVEHRVLARLRGPALPLEVQSILELGLQHEQQHQELILTDILHAFSRNPLRPAYRLPREGARSAREPISRDAASEFQTVAAGLYAVGDAGEGFAFDNERPLHHVWLEEFRIARRPLPNRAYREFVRDGGYRNPLLWMADGWALIEREEWQRPLYWNDALDAEFTLEGERELDLDAPVSHLSYYEADACARWSGARLPTEFEWEVAARARASRPLHDLGDVWEWTASAYAPYPRFQPSSGALGEYNGKFMANQFVLRGGSKFTPLDHARLSYRNFFYPQARWQRAGLRLARDG